MNAPETAEELQAVLREAGWYAGQVDGKVGPMTKAALLRWAASLPSMSRPHSRQGRDINQRSIDLIKHFESCFLEAYRDHKGIWTIGYGHTGLVHRDGTVYEGRKITEFEAEKLFRHDMNVFENSVEELVKVPLNDDEFGALVAFQFNTGGLGTSGLLRRLNGGENREEIANEEFEKWTRSGDDHLRGLLRRRWSERNLFLGKAVPIVDVAHTPRSYQGKHYV